MEREANSPDAIAIREQMTKGREDEGLTMRKESEFLSEEKRLSARMGIYAPRGTKVRVVQKSCGRYFRNVDVLEMGAVYTVEKTEVYEWHTYVFLKEFPGLEFNSVCFENADENNYEDESLIDDLNLSAFDPGKPFQTLRVKPIKYKCADCGRKGTEWLKGGDEISAVCPNCQGVNVQEDKPLTMEFWAAVREHTESGIIWVDWSSAQEDRDIARLISEGEVKHPLYEKWKKENPVLRIAKFRAVEVRGE